MDISGIDHATLLAALYNAAVPVGLGFLQATPEAMTTDEAGDLLAKSSSFDYVRGRPLKIRFAGDVLHGDWLYDRDQGLGKCARIVAELRAKVAA